MFEKLRAFLRHWTRVKETTETVLEGIDAIVKRLDRLESDLKDIRTTLDLI